MKNEKTLLFYRPFKFFFDPFPRKENILEEFGAMAMAMAIEKRVMALLLVICSAMQLSIGAVYKVGDSSGWTTVGNVDYKQWALTKSFKVGDTILFQYNPQFHNVMQVTHRDYRSCNTTAPIATHTSGNDSITITTHGHHHFFCGVPGHCLAGQKVDINVPRFLSIAPTPSEMSSPPVPAVTAPSPSASAPLYTFKGMFGNLGLAMAFLAASLFGFA